MKKGFLCLVLMVISLEMLYAQDGIGLRSGISMDKKISKRFKINAVGQFRFNNNISYLQTHMFELGGIYKYSKAFDAAVFYRFMNRRKGPTKEFKNKHRFYVDLGYNKKMWLLKVENRLRYQHQFKDNDGVNEFDASYIRSKLGASYPNKTKFTPYVSNDFFFKIGGTFDQIRPKIGCSYEINKKNEVDVSVFKDVVLVGTERYGPVFGLVYKF